jgi:hypothetical protein
MSVRVVSRQAVVVATTSSMPLVVTISLLIGRRHTLSLPLFFVYLVLITSVLYREDLRHNSHHFLLRASSSSSRFVQIIEDLSRLYLDFVQIM